MQNRVTLKIPSHGRTPSKPANVPGSHSLLRLASDPDFLGPDFPGVAVVASAMEIGLYLAEGK